jgi:3-hydroxyacyl-[acyl-carrier-protein] dehydratase
MPGVLILEALFQASAWLVRRSDDFAHAAVVLQQANSVKYSGFVQPGQTLVLAAEIVKRDQQLTTLKARGTSGDTQVVSAKLILRQFNLADENPGRACDDQYARAQLQQLFTTLYRPDPSFQPAPG